MSLHICKNCGHQALEKLKNCPDCKENSMVQVAVHSDSVMKEKITLEGTEYNLITSIYAIQDLKMSSAIMKKCHKEPTEEEILLWKQLDERGYFGSILTPEPTEEEVKDWQYYDKLFKKMDFEKVCKKYNVKFLRDDEPYSYILIDSIDCEDATCYNDGEPYEWMKKAKNFDYFWVNWKDKVREDFWKWKYGPNH